MRWPRTCDAMILRFWMAYALTGTVCIVIGLFNKKLRTLAPLGILLVALAALDGYAEKWGDLKVLNFAWTDILLLILFLLSYGYLSIYLISKRLNVGPSQAVWASASHILLAWFVGLACLSLMLSSEENPAFTLLVFLALVCVLHVPTFAAFRNRFMRAAGTVSNQSSRAHDESKALSWIALVILAVPFLAAFAFQFSGAGDWRLIVPNAAISGAVWGLFRLSR